MTAKRGPTKPTQHAHKRIAEQREALRQKFKGVEYLRQIDKGMTELDGQKTKVSNAKNTADNPYLVQDTQAKADCVTRIVKLQMDVNFRRLAKVLPDLKQYEFTDQDGNNPLGTLAAALAAAVSDK